MDIEFNWVSPPEPKNQSTVEEEVAAAFEEGAVKACHPGAISITLEIGGPLNTTLTGSAKCACGRVVTTFTGDETGSQMSFNLGQKPCNM